MGHVEPKIPGTWTRLCTARLARSFAMMVTFTLATCVLAPFAYPELGLPDSQDRERCRWLCAIPLLFRLQWSLPSDLAEAEHPENVNLKAVLNSLLTFLCNGWTEL